jgi:hypothetical protein
MDERCSARVRKILKYEGRAAKLRRRYGGTAGISPEEHRAARLQRRARALTVRLTPGELGELRRIRSAP